MSSASSRCILSIAIICTAAAASAQSRRTLAELGRLNPPAYAPPLVREQSAPVFDEAIDAYRAKKFERAADVLRRFVTAEPEDAAGNFFLAAALMMTDEVGEAEDRLRVVLEAGATAFEGPARFVLAKARIRLGDLAGAEQELMRVAAAPNPYSRDAGELLAKVRAVKKR